MMLLIQSCVDGGGAPEPRPEPGQVCKEGKTSRSSSTYSSSKRAACETHRGARHRRDGKLMRRTSKANSNVQSDSGRTKLVDMPTQTVNPALSVVREGGATAGSVVSFQNRSLTPLSHTLNSRHQVPQKNNPTASLPSSPNVKDQCWFTGVFCITTPYPYKILETALQKD